MSPPRISAFISYAKADQAKAQEIAASLEQRGFKCWIAPRDVRPGRTYGDEIIRGIEASRALILVLSSASNGSAFVSREIERAVCKDKHVFTVRIEDVLPSPALELFISSTQWIDAYSGRIGPHVDRLAQLLAEDEAADAAAPAAPVAARTVGRRPFWLSPWLLGAGAAVLLAIVGALALYLLRTPDDTDYTVLARSCERLSGEAAIGACDRAIASRKFNGTELAGLFAARGFQRQMKADIEGALSDYREAIKRGSTNPWVFNNRGYIYSEAHDFEKALADFDRAIELDPRHADALATRAWIRQQKGELDAAKRDYEQGLAASPSAELKARIEQGLDQIDKSDPDFRTCDSKSGAAAIAACDRAIGSGKFSGRSLAILYNDRGYLRLVQGDLDTALTDLGEAIRIDPSGPYPHWNRAEVYRSRGDARSAKADYERALSLGPRAEDRPKIEAALNTVTQAASQEAKGADGFFGPDTRRAVDDFTGAAKLKLLADYAHVGVLAKDQTPFCNATLVGDSLVLTSNYCLAEQDPQQLTFVARKLDGKLLEARVTEVATGAPIRGVAGDQRIAVAKLAVPLGNEIGWVKKLGGEPAAGDKLDIAAIDIRHGSADRTRVTVSGAATDDPNCVVLERQAGSDIFAHRCISPEGSGGAPMFDAATGTLVGIVGETDTQNRVALAYRDEAKFKERIVYGECLDGGTIDVKLNGGKLDWKWSGVEDVVVTAELESAGN